MRSSSRHPMPNFTFILELLANYFDFFKVFLIRIIFRNTTNGDWLNGSLVYLVNNDWLIDCVVISGVG